MIKVLFFNRNIDIYDEILILTSKRAFLHRNIDFFNQNIVFNPNVDFCRYIVWCLGKKIVRFIKNIDTIFLFFFVCCVNPFHFSQIIDFFNHLFIDHHSFRNTQNVLALEHPNPLSLFFSFSSPSLTFHIKFRMSKFELKLKLCKKEISPSKFNFQQFFLQILTELTIQNDSLYR